MADIQRTIGKATRSIGKILGKVQVILSHLWRLSSKMTKKMTKKLAGKRRRSLLKRGGRRGQATRGFVLPTVTMVLLVVALLTTAMVLRSFDRSKNAQNFRLNEATLNAAAPALDRARAKIEELFNDPTLPRGSPTDEALLGAMTNQRYRFGDETPLKLVFDVDGKEGIGEEDPDTAGSVVENQETVTTAWKFPVDTDNNGKFDTFTLYGILFRSPLRDKNGEFKRRRNPLEARTPPLIDDSQRGRQCESSVTTSARLVGNSGWYSSGNQIKKVIFVYAANVPITDLTDLSTANYETFSGGRKGFSALEYQQDRSRIPLNNNAVVYRDDLAIFPGTRLNLNGRVVANSNLLIGNLRDNKNADVRLFLVSSPASCYYEEEMSKVIVGGNLGAGGIVGGNRDADNAHIDLFGLGGPSAEEQNFGAENKTVEEQGGAGLSYNTFAFNKRIDYMVRAALWRGNDSAKPLKRKKTKKDPEEVQKRVAERLEENPGANKYEVRKEELENYFRDRTRQVPFAEVRNGKSALRKGRAVPLPRTSADNRIEITNETEANEFFAAYTEGEDSTGQNPLRPPYYWMYPFNWNDNSGSGANSYTGLQQRLRQPPATDPDRLQGKEERVGDRVLVGNNLPRKIYDPDSKKFVEAAIYEQVVRNSTGAIKWLNAGAESDSDKDRIRKSRVQELPDIGVAARDNFWELSAAEAPANKLDNVGGLRVVTGTGIYLRDDEDVTATNPPPVWPDYMPVPKDRDDVFDENGNDVSSADSDRPYLQMRATAVYHHKISAYDGTADPVEYQEPIACVSSYYDPTDENSAENRKTLPYNADPDGKSNNGVVYPWSDTLSSNRNILNYQARLEYPNGRRVNPLLKAALEAIDDPDEQLSLAERTAIDTAICAVNILRETVTPSTAAIDHGTIYETTFLDARQVKAIDAHSLRVKWNGRSYEFDDGLGTPSLRTGDLVTLQGFNSATLNFSREPIVVTDKTGKNFKITGASSTDNETGWLTETLSGRYDLSIEERQPLEIRATVLDLDKMRKKTVGSGTPTEYLLPNSGIVYATREDALPDETNKGGDGEPSLELSATDFLLDPTRRPNAIMLINGEELNRGDSNDYRVNEKGLILVSPLPVYIKGDFNLHTGGDSKQEFTEKLKENWSNFYTRTTLNDQFACRKGQFGSGTCSPGDKWRAATVISDALTLLSDNFREGYRNEGDYDLNNNLGDAESISKRRENGFYTNNFVTSHNFNDANQNAEAGKSPPTPLINSSYFNNFITPIQRRANGNREYLMEVCPKLPVSACGSMDWYITPPGFIRAPDEKIYDEGLRTIDVLINISVPPTTAGDPPPAIASSNVIGESYDPENMLSGTTIIPTGADLAGADFITDDFTKEDLAKLRRYPRRVAFLRDYRPCTPPKVSALEATAEYPEGTASAYAENAPKTCDGDLILDANPDGSDGNQPIPIGIAENNDSSRGEIRPFPYKTAKLDVNADGDTDPQDEVYCGWGITDTSKCPKHHPGKEGRPYLGPEDETLWFVTVDELPTGSALPDIKARNYGHHHPLFYRTLDNEPIGEYAPGTEGRKWQPLLEPVLQLRIIGTIGTSGSAESLTGNIDGNGTYWQQQATDAGNTFNLVLASGDTPGRPNEGNGGLANFPRFLESWNAGSGARPARIGGGFLQTKRSVFATAPFVSLLKDLGGIRDKEAGIFGQKQLYKHKNGGGSLPYYNPPDRLWGFDVGLLTQQPDLFAQRFTVPPTSPPNEFFREVSRDDKWVEVLLCAGQPEAEADGTIAGGYSIDDGNKAYYKETDLDYKYAVSKYQRPNCKKAVKY